jgi:hypothetical protein
VRDLADDVVEEEAVEPTGEERPDRRERAVDLEVVADVTRDGGGEDRRDAGEPDERAGDVLAVACGFVGVVTERSEDGARALQDEERPQEPRLVAA